MKAIVKTDPGPGQVAYTDFTDPEVRPGEVVIEVKAAGLCGTDMSLYDWKESMIREYKPVTPLVMGHEFAGVVSEVGPGATRFKVGDRVTGNGIMYCGECYFCRSGRHGICLDRPMIGVRFNGCFAQFVSLREGNVFLIPPDVPFDTASMTEVLCVALHTMERVPVGPGDTVVVIGPGPMGFLVLLMAQAAGASQLFVTGLAADKDRLSVAASLGAQTIVVDEADPAEVVRDLTRGLGADIVFECAGHPDGVPQALTLVRRGGRIGVLGQGAGDSSFNTAILSYLEADLIGVRAHDHRIWHRSYDVLASGKIPLDSLITHRLPMDEAVRGFELMKRKEGLKILFTPSSA